jgi:hypothetical protein
MVHSAITCTRLNHAPFDRCMGCLLKLDLLWRVRGRFGHPAPVHQRYNPLLKQLSELVFDPSRPPLPTLMRPHHPRKGMFSKGIGMLGGLMGRGEVHPVDFERVVFVVVGGATGYVAVCVPAAHEVPPMHVHVPAVHACVAWLAGWVGPVRVLVGMEGLRC